MKLSELIQALLDIQYLAGEDVEITGSILDHCCEPINRRCGVIMPKLVHHQISLEQVCIISVNDGSYNNVPERDDAYVYPDEVMGKDWVYGEAPTNFTPLAQLVSKMEEENALAN